MAHAIKPSLDILNCNYEGVAVACGPKGLKAPPQFLYRNNGDGTFTDVSKEPGIASFRGSYGLTAVVFDADEDGWPDIYVACDTTSSSLLLNNLDGTFREEGLMRGVAISPDGEEMAGMGIGIGEYDLDGHLDIVIMNQHEPPSLLRNDCPKENHWLKVRLEGTKSNRSAIGARVLVHCGSKVQAQAVLSQTSYMSSNDPRLHFGLGVETTADIEVHWPSEPWRNIPRGSSIGLSPSSKEMVSFPDALLAAPECQQVG
jgi:hypothetical protein